MTSTTNLHALLLLSDSALPLGSFAFSSGLESHLAHSKTSTATSNPKPSPPTSTKLQDFEHFLSHSISNLSSTALPYVLSAYHDPCYDHLETLDNDFDASTPCTVARRASLTQGRALLAIWERALHSSVSPSDSRAQTANQTLTTFATALKTSKPDSLGLQQNAHFPPLFGLVCLALGLGAEETSYLFLLSHAKAVLSAAVRASVMGPYQSQAVLASEKLQGWIRRYSERDGREGGSDVFGGEGVARAEEAAVTVPMMDLWMGRHELLYSRIFNS